MCKKRELLSAVLANVFSSHNPFYYRRSSTCTPILPLVHKRLKQQVMADGWELLPPCKRQLCPPRLCPYRVPIGRQNWRPRPPLRVLVPRRDTGRSPPPRARTVGEVRTGGGGKASDPSARPSSRLSLPASPRRNYSLCPSSGGAAGPAGRADAVGGHRRDRPVPATGQGQARPPGQRDTPCACALSSPRPPLGLFHTSSQRGGVA